MLKLPANLNEPIDLTNFVPQNKLPPNKLPPNKLSQNKLPKFETRNKITFPEEQWNIAILNDWHRQVDKIMHERKMKEIEEMNKRDRDLLWKYCIGNLSYLSNMTFLGKSKFRS